MFKLHAHKSGITINANAQTLEGAKREASAWITHGGGSVSVISQGVSLCTRHFWENGSRFGWENWKNA